MPSYYQELTGVVSEGLQSVETPGETTGEGLGEACGQRRKEPRRSWGKRRSSRCVGGSPGDPARQPRGWCGLRRGRRMAGQVPAQPLPKPATSRIPGATFPRRTSGGPNLGARHASGGCPAAAGAFQRAKEDRPLHTSAFFLLLLPCCSPPCSPLSSLLLDSSAAPPPPSAVDHFQLPSRPPSRSHRGCHVHPPYFWRAHPPSHSEASATEDGRGSLSVPRLCTTSTDRAPATRTSLDADDSDARTYAPVRAWGVRT